MANVLPQEFQKKAWSIFRARLIAVGSLVLLVLSIALALTLFPSYVALSVAAPPAPPASVASKEEADLLTIERARFMVRELKGVLDATSSPSAIIEGTLSHKPTGVRVTRIIYSGGENGQITLIGSGAREQVSAFKDALVATGAFVGVSIPVSALVGSQDGGFSIVLSGTF